MFYIVGNLHSKLPLCCSTVISFDTSFWQNNLIVTGFHTKLAVWHVVQVSEVLFYLFWGHLMGNLEHKSNLELISTTNVISKLIFNVEWTNM